MSGYFIGMKFPFGNFWSDKNVLVLERGGGWLYNIGNVLNVTELYVHFKMVNFMVYEFLLNKKIIRKG